MNEIASDMAVRGARGIGAAGVLILCPSSSKDLYGAGNWKDVKALELSLRRLGVPFETIGFESDAPERAFDRTPAGVADILIQYSFWPELAQAARKRWPSARIHVRTVNAEPYQHWQRMQAGAPISVERLRVVYGVLRLAHRDSLCRRRADNLLGISDWDDRNYWRWLPGQANICAVPYYSPWPELRPKVVPLPWSERSDSIVCLAGGRDRIGSSQVEGMIRLAEFADARDCLKDWSFEISPGVLRSTAAERDMGRVTQMNQLEEPWDLLCSVKALAMLTPLGFGAKTTVIDALAGGCHVVIDKVIASRLPEVVRRECQVVDVSKESGIAEALDRIQAEPPASRANDRLAAMAKEGLSACLSAAGPAHEP